MSFINIETYRHKMVDVKSRVSRTSRGTKQRTRITKKVWKMEVLKNVTERVKQIFPYVWQAHHILPENVFHCGAIPENITLLILQHTKYDINYGSNIIFLPTLKRNGYYHRLPYHLGSHPMYDKYVIDELKDFMEEHKQQKCKAISGIGFENRLYEIENKVFKYITIVLGPGITINTYIR